MGGLTLNSLVDAKGTAAQQDITTYHSALEGNENAAPTGQPQALTPLISTTQPRVQWPQGGRHIENIHF